VYSGECTLGRRQEAGSRRQVWSLLTVVSCGDDACIASNSDTGAPARAATCMETHPGQVSCFLRTSLGDENKTFLFSMRSASAQSESALHSKHEGKQGEDVQLRTSLKHLEEELTAAAPESLQRKCNAQYEGIKVSREEDVQLLTSLKHSKRPEDHSLASPLCLTRPLNWQGPCSNCFSWMLGLCLNSPEAGRAECGVPCP